MALRTRMKVCGITVQEDARAAVAAGADGLGFIFVAQSPRVVDPDMVRAITGELPPFVDSIGVFRDEKIEVNVIPSGVNSGIGLNNVKKRLELVYPNRHFLKIEQNETFFVQLKLEI